MTERDFAIVGGKLNTIVAKCEQYWNESGISDAEVHAALEFIHRAAWDIKRQIDPSGSDPE